MTKIAQKKNVVIRGNGDNVDEETHVVADVAARQLQKKPLGTDKKQSESATSAPPTEPKLSPKPQYPTPPPPLESNRSVSPTEEGKVAIDLNELKQMLDERDQLAEEKWREEVRRKDEEVDRLRSDFSAAIEEAKEEFQVREAAKEEEIVRLQKKIDDRKEIDALRGTLDQFPGLRGRSVSIDRNEDPLTGDSEIRIGRGSGRPPSLMRTYTRLPRSAKELFDLLGNEEAHVQRGSNFGQQIIRDRSALRRRMTEYAQDTKGGYKELLNGLEGLGKYAGFLGTLQPSIQSPGPTSGLTAPAGFLEMLAELVRITHFNTFVYHLLATTVTDSGRRVTTDILVPRNHNLPEPAKRSDFVLATKTAYKPISSSTQAVVNSFVPLSVEELGLGLGDTEGTRPAEIPEFYDATSILPLVNRVGELLLYNYYGAEDLFIRDSFFSTTKLFYNDNGEATASIADVTAGDGGQLTHHFLASVYAEMRAAKVPTFSDGSYILITHPAGSKQLRSSLDNKLQASTKEEVEQITDILKSGMIDASRVVGRVASPICKVEGFWVYETNAHSVGMPDLGTPANSPQGVHSETFGATAYVTRDSIACGRGAVGRGISMDFTIREGGRDANYGRGASWIWNAYEAHGLMDVDEAIASEQQTRVFKLRTTDRFVA